MLACSGNIKVENISSNKQSYSPANISTSDQRRFNVVDQRWNNVDPMLKMKQKPTLCFQRCIFKPTLDFQRCFDVETTLVQRCFNLASTLAKAILNPFRLVMIMDLQIDE